MTHLDKISEFGADDEFTDCPLKGLRGPSLAAEGLSHIFERLADLGEKELITASQLFVPAESWDGIISDYYKSISIFDAIIRVKTAFGPYSLSFYFPAIGRDCFVKC